MAAAAQLGREEDGCNAARSFGGVETGTAHMIYQEFTVSSALDGKNYHCRFYTLKTGIAPRHSDTADVRFLVNGKVVLIAVPHVALAEYRLRTGQGLSDADVKEVAALSLKELLERGDWVEESLVTLSPQQALEQAQKLPSPVSG